MHEQTLAIGVPSLIILIALIVGAIRLIRDDGGAVLAIAAPLMVLVGIACIIGIIIAVSTEISLNRRDAAIKSQLGKAGITWIGLGVNDDRIVAETQGCRAEFKIKDDANPGAWLLVSGTGRAISECTGMDLDKLFIRS